jgi:16S rRNA A1518/A1519 N6-dimethyltransferase RsmA/KsgA/DIM1 with predicted DNA glycosylase/AP lyase activity
LLSAFKDRLDKPQVDAILTRMALGADARAEQLSVEQMLALCEIVREQLATN